MFRSITSFVLASLLLLSTAAQADIPIVKHGKKFKRIAVVAAVVGGYLYYCKRSKCKHFCYQGNKGKSVEVKQRRQSRSRECHTPGCRRD